MQVSCTTANVVTSVDANFPGSVHDQRIFRRSALNRSLHAPGSTDAVLGDSGYAVTHHVFTPYLNPAGEAQRAYNRAQVQGRLCIERVFGIIKRRWAAVGKKVNYSAEKACRYFACSCILHNFIRFCEIAEYDALHGMEDEEADALPPTANTTGQEYRNLLSDMYFGD